MVYVFDGPRNSGKSFFSKLASQHFGVHRFQFDFVGGFNLLDIQSKSKEAHCFALGKEMMIMQLARELSPSLPKIIHDRGVLSVLAWGILEGRISKEEALSEINYFENKGFLSGLKLIYIDGKNPNRDSRNKDQWDFADGSDDERKVFEWLIQETVLKDKISIFKNNFDEQSVQDFIDFFEKKI